MGGGVYNSYRPESGSEPHYGSDSMLEHLSISWGVVRDVQGGFFLDLPRAGESRVEAELRAVPRAVLRAVRHCPARPLDARRVRCVYRSPPPAAH